jgi:hypothetical protein
MYEEDQKTVRGTVFPTIGQSLSLPNMISIRLRRSSYIAAFLRDFRPGMQTFIALPFGASRSQLAS